MLREKDELQLLRRNTLRYTDKLCKALALQEGI